MQSLADRLASLPPSDRAEFFASISDVEAKGLLYNWRGFHARGDQVAPAGDWDIWLVLAGRGWGKTRVGSEWVRESVESGARRIALVAETAADARDVMVEGESGVLSVYPDDERPEYEPSKRRLTWPNGAVATLYNATEPDQLRGPQHDLAWCDELAKWRYARETWDQLQFGLRLGSKPRSLVTTTPRPIELVKSLLSGGEGEVVTTRGKTLDNASNLAAPFMAKIQKRYAGTRLGRQELNAEILSDLPGALWTAATLDTYRRTALPAKEDLKRIIVSVDPAVTGGEESDEHGIMVLGQTNDDEGVLLKDGSLRGSPNVWARQVVALYDHFAADCVVAEVNQGGDMVESTIKSVRSNINVKKVRATRGKHVRAEPISALYEQGRIYHAGAFPELEEQMSQMTNQGYEGENSPDRLDALVWAATELFPDLADPVRNDWDFSDTITQGGWMA